jgi:hypothetical protein
MFNDIFQLIVAFVAAAYDLSLQSSRLILFQYMTNNTEHPHVALALIDESKEAAPEKSKDNSKPRRPRKNYCSEDYIVGYGILVLVIILIIVLVVLVIIYIRRYNANCASTKGASCRGSLRYFT